MNTSFVTPRVGDGVLRPPHEGIACRNIRDALRFLDYPLAPGMQYDEELKKAVLRFQTDYGHKNHDGLVGPGTRKLLTKAVIDTGEQFFGRSQISPEYALFLSYSRKDEGRLSGIVNGIRARGIPVFRDKEAIPGGASWPGVLYRSVQKCQVFLCMLSPQSARSINVLIEVTLARHANRPIVPVLLQAAALPSTLQSLLEGIQHVDLSGQVDSEEGLDELLGTLAVYGLCPQPQ